MKTCEWNKTCEHCDHKTGGVYVAGYKTHNYICCHCGRAWEHTTREQTGTWVAESATAHGPHVPIVTVTW